MYHSLYKREIDYYTGKTHFTPSILEHLAVNTILFGNTGITVNLTIVYDKCYYSKKKNKLWYIIRNLVIRDAQ